MIDFNELAIQSVVSVKNASEESLEEISEILKAFKKRNSTEAKRKGNATDSEYWFCVCFETRDQVEEYLGKIGLNKSLKYINGFDLAEKTRVNIESPSPDFRETKINKRFSSLETI